MPSKRERSISLNTSGEGTFLTLRPDACRGSVVRRAACAYFMLSAITFSMSLASFLKWTARRS